MLLLLGGPAVPAGTARWWQELSLEAALLGAERSPGLGRGGSCAGPGVSVLRGGSDTRTHFPPLILRGKGRKGQSTPAKLLNK